MAALNLVQLIGNLGRDPETRYTPGGSSVTNISLGTTEHWNDKTSGEKKEATEWHRVVFFGKLAEVAGEYLKKGSLVYVAGKVKTRKWQDKDGRDRYTTEIIADSLQMLGTPGGRRDTEPRSEPRAEPEKKPEPKKPAGKFDDLEDDIPF